MLYAIAASATLIFVLAVPRSAAKARRRLARLWRAQEAWAEQMDRESQSRPQSPLVGSWRGPRKEDDPTILRREARHGRPGGRG